MAKHNELGKWGEQKALDHLRNQGYTIRATDWRSGHRDLDIVALSPDQTTVVFVEVKTRASDEITSPDEAVDRKKIMNIGYAANDYVKEFDVQEELRFDIISIVGTNDDNMRIEHVEDAFNPLLV